MNNNSILYSVFCKIQYFVKKKKKISKDVVFKAQCHEMTIDHALKTTCRIEEFNPKWHPYSRDPAILRKFKTQHFPGQR